MQAAAWDSYALLHLKINPENSGAHCLDENYPVEGESVLVSAVDIGFWLNSWNVGFNFAKIDTEGSELKILQSLERSGLRFPMAIEMHSTEMYIACKEVLQRQGYRVEPEAITIGVCYALL